MNIRDIPFRGNFRIGDLQVEVSDDGVSFSQGKKQEVVPLEAMTLEQVERLRDELLDNINQNKTTLGIVQRELKRRITSRHIIPPDRK